MQRDLLADENSFMSMRCFSRLNLRKIYRILDNFSSLNAVIDLECFVVIGTCLYWRRHIGEKLPGLSGPKD